MIVAKIDVVEGGILGKIEIIDTVWPLPISFVVCARYLHSLLKFRNQKTHWLLHISYLQ
jgi:hypothetical protein